MIRTSYIYFKFSLLTLLSIGTLKKSHRLQSQEEKDNLVFTYVTELTKRVLHETRTELIVHGKENVPMGPVLYVCNHQGRFDIPVLIAGLPGRKGFIAKKEMEKIPIYSKWMEAIHCVFLDRENDRKALKSILKGIENLKKGYSMIVFPEGEKTGTEAMTEFKRGTFKLATKPKVPIVPVTIDGTYKIWEEHSRIKDAKVNIYIHPPIYTKDLSKSDEANLHIKVQAIIESGLNDKVVNNAPSNDQLSVG